MSDERRRGNVTTRGASRRRRPKAPARRDPGSEDSRSPRCAASLRPPPVGGPCFAGASRRLSQGASSQASGATTSRSFATDCISMPAAADRAADTLVQMFNLAAAWGWRAPEATCAGTRPVARSANASAASLARRSAGSGKPSTRRRHRKRRRWDCARRRVTFSA